VLASYPYLSAGSRLISGGIAEAAVFSLDGDIVFHPYVRRPVPFDPDCFDLTSVYDFGGFWFSTTSPAKRQVLLTEFERAFTAYAGESHVVCEFMRCHPMSEVGALTFERYDLRKHQDNVVVRISAAIDEVRAGYSDNRRRRVRQGIRNGLMVEFVDDPSVFMAAYYASLDRYEAHGEYYFPVTFIDAIKEHLLITHVRTADGELCAAFLFLIDGNGIYLFLGASMPDKLPLRPNDFGYDAIIQYAIAHKLDYFHIGGGAETLYRFKSSFSPFTVPFHHARCIFLPERYDELVRLHASGDTNFFPRYRAGLRSERPPAGAQGPV
jgi:Acetyltransferase (GNAT) domain